MIEWGDLADTWPGLGPTWPLIDQPPPDPPPDPFARPVVHDTAEDLYRQLGPLTRDDGLHGWMLLRLVAAATGALDEVEQLARDHPDGRPGWSTVVDVDLAPPTWLPWLGQFVGVRLPGDVSSPTARRRAIRDQASARRGTPAALAAAITATLRGSQRLELIERDGGAYRLTVRIYESEVVSLAAVEAAVASQKPAGIVAVIDVRPGATYRHMRDVHGPTYADFAHEFETYRDARDHVPEEEAP